MDKTKVKYELTILPNLPPSHEHYQRELTNRRLEKMQFPTRDEQFKRRLEAGGARIVTQSSGDKSASKDRDRSRNTESSRKMRRPAPGRSPSERRTDPESSRPEGSRTAPETSLTAASALE